MYACVFPGGLFNSHRIVEMALTSTSRVCVCCAAPLCGRKLALTNVPKKRCSSAEVVPKNGWQVERWRVMVAVTLISLVSMVADCGRSRGTARAPSLPPTLTAAAFNRRGAFISRQNCWWPMPARRRNELRTGKGSFGVCNMLGGPRVTCAGRGVCVGHGA